MNILSNLSIRRKLLLLFFVIIIPFLVITLYSTFKSREEAMENARKRTIQMVETVVAEQRIKEASTRQLLSTLAKLPEFQRRDASKCSEILRELSKQNSIYSNLLLADSQGNAIASAQPFKPFNIKHRKYFKEVQKTMDFSVGEYAFAIVASKPVLHYAYPVRDKKNALKGVLVAAFDLERYEDIFKKSGLPQDSNLAITDHKGVRLFRFPIIKDAVGQHDLPKMMDFMSGSDEKGTFLTTGLDNVKRLYAYSRIRLRDQDLPYMYIRAGIPESVALAGTNKILKRNIFIIGLTVLVSILFAWYLGKVLFIRRLEQLNAFAQRVHKGETNVYTGIPHTGDELGVLANSFDSMAKSLIEREAVKDSMLKSLQESEEQYRSLFETSTQGIIIYDHPGIIKLANPAMMTLLGAAYLDEIRGCRYLDFIHPDDRAESAVRIGKIFQNIHETPNDIGSGQVNVPIREHRMIRTNGDVVIVESTGAAFQSQGKMYIQGLFRDITERKRLEETLRQTYEFNQRLLDTSPAFIVAIGADGKTRMMNRAMLEFLNYKAEEIEGCDYLTTFVPEEDRSILKAIFKDIMESGKTTINENRIIGRSGSMCLIEWHGQPVLNMDGKFDFVVGVGIDITDRKRAEEELREKELKYRLIFENAPLGLLHFDQNGIITACNDIFIKMVGSSRELLIGLNMLNLLDVYMVAAVRKALNGQIGLYEGEYESVAVKKKTWVKCIFAPVLLENNQFLGGTGIVDDITDRKQAEEALRKSEGKYRNLFENAIDGIFQTTVEGQFISANPALARIFGYESPDELTSSLSDIAHQLYVDPEKRSKYLQIIKKNGYIKSFDAEFYRKDGKKIWLSLTSHEVRNDEGELQYIEGTAKDVTELKTIEKQLFEAQKMEAVGRLAGGIAHDFNNILGAIIGYSELIELTIEEPDTDTQRRYIEQVLKASERAKSLIAQILAFSRHAEYEKKPVDMKIITKEVLKLLQSTLPKTISIRQNITNKPAMIYADPTQIHQVLMNLCTNAVHAMGERGGILEVNLSQAFITSNEYPHDPDMKPGSYVKLSVSDTGHGIDKAIMDRIYDPFFTTKVFGEGTGLGLSVVYGIIKNHEGTIRVDSNLGEGATFNVYIPNIEEEPAKHIQELNIIPEGHEHILFVDDEIALVELGNKILSALGYDVTTCTDGMAALKTIHDNPGKYDLVITDMTMPHMTGSDLAVEILKENPNMPIILCSGFNPFIDETRATELGIKAFIMKPINRRNLAVSVREVLDRRKK